MFFVNLSSLLSQSPFFAASTIVFMSIILCYCLSAVSAGPVTIHIAVCVSNWKKKRVARAPTIARATVVMAAGINNESQGRTTLQTPPSSPPTDTAESPCPNG